MSYNGSGTFNINTAGQPVVTGTVISSTAFNALTADLATGLSTAITKDGQTAATARIPFAQGISSTLVTDSTSTTTGSIITAGGVGIAKALYVGTTANFGGVASYSAQPIFSSLTASSAVATDASKGLVSVTNTGTGNNVLATSPTLVTPILGTPTSGSLVNCTDINYTGFKNRIINGAMVIDQRNAGASVTMSNAVVFTVDRWWSFEDSDGTMTAQRSTTAPAGFINSLVCTTTSADASLGATQRVVINQGIEGFNIADLGWGTANAQTVTLSFWVRSSLTGTFGGALKNAGTRSYPYSYTISAANTWEFKTVTVAGDTSGTWATDNTVGMQVQFGLGVGSTYSGTAGAWVSADLNSVTGAVSVVGTNGATFYITGVQLEKGSTATSFDYRPYGTELALCQRYFYKTFSQSVAAPSASKSGAMFVYQVANNAAFNARFPVTMRATPTCTPYDMSGNANQCTFGTTNRTAGINSDFPGDSGCMVFSNAGLAQSADVYCHLIASAEL
jgi:hypothetical protein